MEPKRPHLAMQHANGVGRRVVRAEGIGADEFGEPAGPVRRGRVIRAHFVQNDRDPGLGRLPRSLRAGQPSADDVNGTHGGFITKAAARVNPAGAAKKSGLPKEPLSGDRRRRNGAGDLPAPIRRPSPPSDER